MFNRKCKITFIAHGTTIYSEENRFADKPEYPPLNEAGYGEINNIVEFIKTRGLKINKIYSSPALSCTQSAEIIADELKQDFEIKQDLVNRNWGIWSGLTLSQINKKYKQEILPLIAAHPENGEDIKVFNNRIEQSITQIINENIRGRLIIVTHPTIIQSVISNALNIPTESQYKIYIKPASATQISYFENWASLVYSDYKPL